jgi:allantoin racemase
MTRILVVNPNTTASMTATIAHAARLVAASETEIVPVTSAMGPVSIEGYYDEAFALPGLLAEIGRGEREGAQAAVIACFDDTGLDAARAMVRMPVIGICEAALMTAALIAKRFTVVTTMERSRVPIEELAHRYGMAGRARIRAANIAVLSLEDPNSGARDRLRNEIVRAIAEDNAEADVPAWPISPRR